MEIDSAYYFLDMGKLKIKYYSHGEPTIIDNPNPLPHCFIPVQYTDSVSTVGLKERTDFRTFDTSQPVTRISFYRPDSVSNFRTINLKRNINTYEADIPYRKVWMRENNITCSNYENQISMDTEEKDIPELPDVKTAKQPIIAIGIVNKNEKEVFVGEEYKILDNFFSYLSNNNIQLIKTWNGINWDWPYIKMRLSQYPDLYSKYDFKRYRIIDLSQIYRLSSKIYKTGWSLEKVATRLLNKEKPFVGQKIASLSEEELKERVLWDAEATEEIDRAKNYSKLGIQMAKISNIFPDDIISENPETHNLTVTPTLDQIFIKKAHELNFVLPSKTEILRAKYPGAFVYVSKNADIIKDVSQLDFASLYPNIMIAFKFAPHQHADDFWIPILKEFLSKKENAESAEIKWAYKIIVNACYGIMASKKYRFNASEEALKTAAKGKEIIINVKDFLDNLGYQVILSDTDSVFVKSKYEDGELLVSLINNFVEKTYNVNNIKIDYEAFWHIIGFPRSASGEGNPKKRYYGLRSENGDINNAEIEIVGLEIVRNDWCELAHEIQHLVIKRKIQEKSNEEILAEINKILDDMYVGKLNHKLILETQIRKKEYKVLPRHIRAYRDALEKGLVPTDMARNNTVKYYMTYGNVPKLINLTKENEIDYSWYYAKQIAPILYRLKIIDSLPKFKVIKRKSNQTIL